jgi:hypothetical protein
MTAGERATRVLPFAREEILDVLLSPLELPSWNPAFQSLSGPNEPRVGQEYTLLARSRLRGHLRYTEIGGGRVRMHWEIPGLAEDGWWELGDSDFGTPVVHGFLHSGPLAAVMQRAFRGVAALRLQRLAAVLVGSPGRAGGRRNL